MYQVKKSVAKKRDAVATIQRRWRATRQAHITRKNFLIQKKACVKLQATFRMYRTRKKYTSIKAGFIKLQAAFRMRQQRQRYVQQKQAVCIILSNLSAKTETSLSGQEGSCDYDTNLLESIPISTTCPTDQGCYMYSGNVQVSVLSFL